MSRLPLPGGDDGTWGNILNAYLEVSLAADGTLNSNIVGTNQIQAGAVTSAQLDSPTQAAINLANSSVQTVNSVSPDSSGNLSLTATEVSAIPASQLGVASGVAQLDTNSTLQASQLPVSVVTGGASGPATWASGTAYVINQLVVSSGVTYICNTAHTSATYFSSDASNWTALGAVGTMPNGGTTGQALTKNSNANGDVGWLSVATIDHTDTPVPDTQSGSPGTSTAAAAQDHSHPLSVLGRNMMFAGFAPSWVNDWTFDGTTQITQGGGGSASQYGPYGGGSGSLFTLSGGVYTWGATMGQVSFMGRNITVNAGVTVKGQTGSGPLAIVASNSITINGTLNVDGGAASGATGGVGSTAPGGAWDYWKGMSGGNGATGVGGAGTGTASNCASVGGFGSNGGASGTGNAGGAAGGGGGILGWGVDFVFLKGKYYTGQAVSPAFGGSGGGGGGGDGTNAGGGGGSGGGIILLIAPQIIISSTAVLSAQGGSGAAGTGGNAGGGGGGGGGLIALHALQLSIASGSQLLTSGGSGGAGAGTGSAGAAGQASQFFVDPAINKGGLGLGAGVLACQWQ